MAIPSPAGDGDHDAPPGAPHRQRAENDALPSITDPLFAWAARTQFAYLGGEPQWIPLLIQTSGATAAEVAASLHPGDSHGVAAWRIPTLFLEPPQGLEKSRHFCLLLDWTMKSRLQSLAVLEVLEKKFGARYEFGLPIGMGTTVVPPDPGSTPLNMPVTPGSFGIDGPPSPWSSAPPSPASSKPPPRKRGPDGVIGIIDDGLALAHERFRHAGNAKTRIDSAWVQDIGTGGTQYTANQIDVAVAACTHAGLVDETEVYRTLGLENYANTAHKVLGRRRIHGTHVMDIASGYDPGTGPANLPLIGVQLPQTIVRDTSGALLTPWAVWGMYYILSVSLGMGAKPGDVPVAINLSYGLFGGPHDGTSVFEMAVDEIVRLWNSTWARGRLCVVLPGGNNFLWRSHARFDLAPSAQQRIDWRVVPDDRTLSAVEFWLPHQAATGPGSPSADVKVTAPDGTTSGWIGVGAPTVVMPPSSSGQPPLWQLTYHSAAVTGSRPRIMLIVRPTAASDPHSASEPVAPSGLWHIDFRNTGPQAIVDGWVWRDDTPLGWPVLGRQSYFDDPAYARFDGAGRAIEVDHPLGYPPSYVLRYGTLNGLATGSRPVVVSAVRKSDAHMARYSAAGPIIPHPATFPPPRVGPDPDAAAVSDDGPAHTGVLAAGSRSNSLVAMGGSSVAAPQLTRWIIRAMIDGHPSCRPGTHALAAIEDGKIPGPPEPPSRAGMGRILNLAPPLPSPGPTVR